LPSYAPELNPDEYLNGDLKLSVAKRVSARDRAALLSTATARLRSLQQQPERVRSSSNIRATNTPPDIS